METTILSGNPACNPSCRACHYKDLDYPAQLLRKQEWAESRLAGWRDVLHAIRPAPEADRIAYRAKSWLRAFAPDGRLAFGMFRAVNLGERWGREFIAWDACPLHVPAIQTTLPRLAGALAAAAPEFVARSLFGVWIGSPHVVLVAKDPLPDAVAKLDWSGILEAPLAAVSFHRTNQVGSSVFGALPIVPVFGRADPSAPPVRAFRQIARTLLEEARGEAVRALLADSPALVVDLYAGTGEIALRLPETTGWIGIEASQEAAAYAGALRDGKRAKHRAFVGFVEHRLRDARVQAEIDADYSLYLNPPRPGLGEAGRALVADLIRERPPKAIVYLSCSASSLARDLAAFEARGARVASLQPYDFFPQTEHFETLAILRP